MKHQDQRQLNLVQVARKFFEDQPQERESVTKAYHAFHVAHFRLDPGAHNFLSSSRTCECFWCGRTRENVRWDSLPAECQSRPAYADLAIEDVLGDEEKKAHAAFKSAITAVPKLVKKLGMTGETLAILHHTYGYDPETVSSVIDVPPEILESYNTRMEGERERSRKAVVRQIISCVHLP